MKRYIHIFTLAILCALTSCVMDNPIVDINPTPTLGNNGIQIIGAVEDFDVKKVGTRADDGEVADSYISEMTMFIFDKEDNIVQGWSKRTVNSVDTDGNPSNVTYDDADKCSSAINIKKGNPTFVIDTKAGMLTSLDDDSPEIIYYDHIGAKGINDLSKCKIYIVANAWHKLEGIIDTIKTLEQLEAVTLDIDNTLAMPKDENGQYRGFPMIGTHLGYANDSDQNVLTFDLSKGGNNKGAVAKIPLKKLYAKVNFTMQINAIQTVANMEPRFKIEKVEVFNVPSKARFGRDLDSEGKPKYDDADDYIVEMVGSDSYTPADYYHGTSDPIEITDFSRTEIVHTPAVNPSENYLIEFGFYMPEHKVTPNATESTYTGYPAGIDPDCKQYYKPLLVGAQRNEDGTTTNAKNATFVRIHGVYTDHNAQIKDVRYDIYLGQDNTDDFTVKRNQLLNNKLVITGLTNYHDAYSDVSGNISVDHRVDVDYKGFNLSMERTAILDAHFEVRPLDIELSPGSTMTVTIPKEYRSWMAMESDAAAKGGNSDIYVNTTDDRKGVRKYFTTNLVSELTAANTGSITISNDANATTPTRHRIWFYIDENPNVFDKEMMVNGKLNTTKPYTHTEGYKVDTIYYRNCPVQFKYYGTDNDNTGGGAATVTKSAIVNFQQWNLWRVWSSDGARYYDIEHEEEYLNNYASDQAYGSTQNGMPYGLDGIQLSNNVLAYWKESASQGLQWLINLFFKTEESTNKLFAQSGHAPFYDFYLSRDAFPTDKLDSSVDKTLYARDYKGQEFNKEIATTLKNLQTSTDTSVTQAMKDACKIDGIILTENPKSAFAYCYHKNKRNSDGTIHIANIKWFLPAIDEIEDIALGAYDEFDKVFQNQKYWSCQPAYHHNSMNITGYYSGYKDWYIETGSLKGEFFEDNKKRARATSIFITNGVTPQNIQSGLPTDRKSGNLNVKAYDGGTKDGQTESSYTSNNIDYTSSYFQDPEGEYRGNRLRTDICRVRAVYRSGTK